MRGAGGELSPRGCVGGKDKMGGCPRRRHWRILVWRHATTCDRGGAEGELGGGRARQCHDFLKRPLERSAGNGGLSRQFDKSDGATRGHRGRLTAPKRKFPVSGAPAKRAALFLVIFPAKGSCYLLPKARQFRQETLHTEKTTCSINQPHMPLPATPVRSQAFVSSNSPGRA